MRRSHRRRARALWGRPKPLAQLSAGELRRAAYAAEHSGDRAKLHAAMDEIKRRGLPAHWS